MKVAILTVCLLGIVLVGLASASPLGADPSLQLDADDADELTWQDKLTFAYASAMDWFQSATWYVRDHVLDLVSYVYPNALQYKTYDS